jgi:copper chaperone
MRTTFEVKGMHCGGCEDRIKTALQRFSAITAMEVDHHRDLVAIEHQDIDVAAVEQTISQLGFTVTPS